MKARLTTITATYILTGIWVTCFALGLGVIGLLFFSNSISSGNVSRFLDQLSAVYVPYLGVMLVYCFATRSRNRRSPKLHQLAFWLALGTSLLWNSVVLGLLFKVLTVLGGETTLNIDEALKLARESGAKLSWVASPAIGFFFAKPSAEKEL
jgi:purine-cytosine permease-like protein